MYFETKLRYAKTTQSGAVRKVTESYLVDALSFTEAEARTIEERSPYMSGEFAVEVARKTKVGDIITAEDADDPKWWSVKWTITTIDEKPAAMGKPPVEKKVACLSMAQGKDIRDAYDRFSEAMKSALADYEIVSISESPVLEVYPYNQSGK